MVGKIQFDSRAEALRYSHLLTKKEDGLIRDLELQKKYEMVVNGSKVCRYVSDFTYFDVLKNITIVEDVKNKYLTNSPLFRLKAKLLKATHNVDIHIVDTKDVLSE
jgi:hypothetical protein